MEYVEPSTRNRSPKRRRRPLARVKKAFQLSEARIRERIRNGTRDTLSLHRRSRHMPKTHTSDHFFSYTEEHHQRDQAEHFTQLEAWWAQVARRCRFFHDDDYDYL